MDLAKQKKFNERMGKRAHLSKGGVILRKHYSAGGSAISGGLSGAGIGTAIVPGIGTAIGAGVGALGGLISSLISGSGPQMPNIVDPVTGQQITDAQGNVVATQAQIQGFVANLQGANGVQNQQAVLSQLQGVANGTGPNPAQAELAQATGQNVAATTAEMAGMRGASSNVGLLARQAAQQGAQTEQNSVGQAATLQANQSLNALNSEGTIAGQQVGETQNALSTANNAATTNQGQLLGAEGSYNSALTGAQGNVNSANQSQLGTLVGAAAPLVAGGLSGAGTTATAAGTTGTTPAATMPNVNSNAFSNSLTQPALGSSSGFAKGGEVLKGPHKSHVANFLMSEGGKVPAMVSPGEISLNPEQVKRVLNGENPLKVGEKIQGKAKTKGDSRKNDTVPKTLDEGGVIIPRSHVKDPEMAELFVRRAVHMKRSK